MHNIAPRIGEDLHFHMPGSLEVAFQKNSVIAEGARGFALTGKKLLLEISRPIDAAHPHPAAAGHSLDQKRITGPVRSLDQMRHGLVFAPITWNHRNAGRFRRMVSQLRPD